MKNIPRIFIDEEIQIGNKITISKDVSHYLTRVMRTDNCLVFNNGDEYVAGLTQDSKFLIPERKTDHTDPSNNITLCFSPIKKTDELINMVTQMGVKVLQPVIMDRTVAHHINWDRMRKILIEASEQSGRNSIPELKAPIKFTDLDKSDLIFADERMPESVINKTHNTKLLIGPEGGFSDSEFSELEAAGAKSLSLGKTILRAETAAVAALVLIQCQ